MFDSARDENATRPGIILRRCVALLVALLVVCPAVAQEAAQAKVSLRVGVNISAPFVMEKDGRYSGMAIELWQLLQRDSDTPSSYMVFPTFNALVDALEKGEIDVAVSNLSITHDRAMKIDFTQPWFDAGQRIMISQDSSTGWDVLNGLWRSGFVRVYFILSVLLLLGTWLLTVFDRRYAPDFPRKWTEGLSQSFLYIVLIISGNPQLERNHFGWVGRVLTGIWLIGGIAGVAFVTSSVTSVMTATALTNQINNLSDLAGKTVGVFAGSVSEEFARKSGLDHRPFSDIDSAIKALREKRIAALIGDAPVLEYYVHAHPQAALSMTGSIFAPDKYGFGLQHASPLTGQVTVELLNAKEQGELEALRIKYFGD
ncbi:transporter substrate-binding domain-containing protein [Pseudomonas sp. UL073]|uniref:Transporter substrate-binding domain-containing protein n=1 Tax=Zestomonas insulae TaxID=2809017 RepID=A0ABS2IA95_9GAMM|nr:transporter substrate-binding domain-containing protein [Pseudomonas insulae]MBM7060049.1 transporter substrate-binding domain-containing protein [Pseudomonas insulae]